MSFALGIIVGVAGAKLVPQALLDKAKAWVISKVRP